MENADRAGKAEISSCSAQGRLHWRTGKRSQGVTASAVSSRLLTTQLKNQEAATSSPHRDLLRVSPGTFKNPGIIGGSKCDVGVFFIYLFSLMSSKLSWNCFTLILTVKA